MRLRGHLLPMTALARALALGEGRGGPSEAELTGEGASEGEPRDATVVVLQADEQRYGLLVEAVHAPRRSSSSRCGRCSTSSAATRARRCSETARSR
nr:chemotaxis protein CheW [Pseudenhygromyxa sp. WMMC2535]